MVGERPASGGQIQPHSKKKNFVAAWPDLAAAGQGGQTTPPTAGCCREGSAAIFFVFFAVRPDLAGTAGAVGEFIIFKKKNRFDVCEPQQKKMKFSVAVQPDPPAAGQGSGPMLPARRRGDRRRRGGVY